MKPTAKYAAIFTSLRQEILDGQFDARERFPSEEARIEMGNLGNFLKRHSRRLEEAFNAPVGVPARGSSGRPS